MEPTLRIEIPEHVMIREVGGECVILDLDTEQYFGLDDIGTEILQLLRDGSTIDQVVTRIVEQYDASADQVMADVAALVGSLLERGLVRPVDNR